jgi:hypothetical protein
MKIASDWGGACSPVRSAPAVACAILVVSMVSFLLWTRDPLLIEEDNVLESAQSILLILAAVIHSIRASRVATSSTQFLVRSGLALLTFSFALRELDIDKFGEEVLWSRIEAVVRLTAGALWIGLLFVSARRTRQIFSHRTIIFSAPAIVLTFIGGLFFIASWPVDKELIVPISLSYARFIEEVLELNACLLLFAASFAGWHSAKARPGNEGEPQSDRSEEKAAV